MIKRSLYVDWNLPKKSRGRSSIIKKPWEIALIIRSTRFSKEYNNWSPVLYCDQKTLEYYNQIGLNNCFDEIFPILPDEIGFDASIFWSAGKFLSILEEKENFIMIDLDLEIRYKLDLPEFDIFCAHLEGVYPDDFYYYPDPIYLDGSDFFGNNHKIKWSDKACNTSILSFSDLGLAKEYSSACLDFAKSKISINPGFDLAYLLLQEQRFLYEFSRSNNLDLKTLISGIYMPKNEKRKIESYFKDSDSEEIGKRGFLHVWGFKNTPLAHRKEQEGDLYNSLLFSRPYLTKQIQDCVNINNEISF
jgi:hypothetical protein